MVTLKKYVYAYIIAKSTGYKLQGVPRKKLTRKLLQK